jgi:YHS domain-containing protein
MTERDPIYRMDVDDSTIILALDGKTHHHCLVECLEKFRGLPEEKAHKDTYDLIIIASGEGAKAALPAKKYLLQLQEGPSFNIVRRGE